MVGRKRFSRTKKRTQKSQVIQCPYCISALQGERRYARHIVTRHPEHIDDYIKGINR